MHVIGGQILEYSERTGGLVPVSDSGSDLVGRVPQRRRKRRTRPMKGPGGLRPNAQAIAAARLARRKKIAEARAARMRKIQEAIARKKAAREAAAKAKRERALARWRAAQGQATAFFQPNLTVENVASAQRILRPRGLRNVYLLFLRAQKGNRRALAVIARTRKIASQAVVPANKGAVAAARATLTAFESYRTGMLTPQGRMPPVTRVDFRNEPSPGAGPQTQAQQQARGQTPVFIPSSDAPPTARQYEEMAPDQEIETTEEAQEEAQEEAAEELTEAESEAETETDQAMEAAEETSQPEEGPSPGEEGFSEDEAPSVPDQSEATDADAEMSPEEVGATLMIAGALDDASSLGFIKRLKRGIRRAGSGISRGARGAGRGIARGARATGRGLKKAGSVAVKIHTMPLKALKALGAGVARLAAKPIRARMKTLAMRRAHLLAWKARGSKQPTATEVAQGAQYALNKARGSMGPLGKLLVLILRGTKRGGDVLGTEVGFIPFIPILGAEGRLKKAYRNRSAYQPEMAPMCPCPKCDGRGYVPCAGVHGGPAIDNCPMCGSWGVDPRYSLHPIGDDSTLGNDSLVGVTGAEVAAVATAIVTALGIVMKKADAPGEAPSNPYSEPPGASPEGSPAPEAGPAPEASTEGPDSPLWQWLKNFNRGGGRRRRHSW